MKLYVFALAAITFLITIIHSQAILAKEHVGVIIAIQGKVFVKNTKRWERATKGTQIFENSFVRTSKKSRAAISFKDGSRLIIGDSSIVSIEKFLIKKGKRKIDIFMFKGKIRNIISPFKGISNIQVKTQGAIAGVRGTEFVMYHKPPVNIIYILRGKVKASTPKYPQEVTLNKGEITENTQGRRMITPDKVPDSIKEAIELLVKSTDAKIPPQWVKSEKLPLILARWNINYGHYLIDKHRFLDAAEVFQIAHDLTQDPEIRAESLVNKGTVYDKFLKDYPKAAFEYRKVLVYYPETRFAEIALFQLGILYWETENYQEAKKIFKRYLIFYPHGKHRESVESLLKRIR